jgi:hypothetical protein
VRRLAIATFAMLVMLGLSCGSGSAAQGSAAQSTAKSGPALPAADLDRLLGPVALYPDTLLAQMLLCTADPVKVVELQNFLQKNAALKGTELQDAATVAGFDPSYVALTIFPQVVKYMADNLEWTKNLGQAFAANRSSVFDSIQRLRAQAQKVGTLKDTPQQEVETKTTSSGQQVIVIEPANPQVVYVPQYNPTVVYTQPPTTVVVQDDDDSAEAVAAGLIGFTAGIALGAAMDNNYYYGPYGWHGGGYMYNDAWDDYYDHREDAREDWMDHREDLMEERGERAEDARENRGERNENRQETRGNTQEQRTERQANRQENRPQSQGTQQRTGTQAATQQRTGTQAATQRTGTQASAGVQQRSGTQAATQTRSGSGSYEARGTSTQRAAPQRSGTSSDAFSGYSSGRSERAASSRGASSRSRGGGGGGRRR